MLGSTPTATSTATATSVIASFLAVVCAVRVEFVLLAAPTSCGTAPRPVPSPVSLVPIVPGVREATIVTTARVGSVLPVGRPKVFPFGLLLQAVSL